MSFWYAISPFRSDRYHDHEKRDLEGIRIQEVLIELYLREDLDRTRFNRARIQVQPYILELLQNESNYLNAPRLAVIRGCIMTVL